jgi:opacity protein-like surface antigen
MKKAVVVTWIAGLAGMTRAFAADLRQPASALQPAAAVTSNWAGPYNVVQAGYLSGGGETTFPGSDEFHFIDPTGSMPLLRVATRRVRPDLGSSTRRT